jgi:2-methylcitrate dehydratase PrpD
MSGYHIKKTKGSFHRKEKNMIERILPFLIDTSFQDLPGEVITQAKRCIMDWVGVAIGGVRHPAISILIETVKELGGARQASILGTPLKSSVLNAALVNGAMSHVLDFDDTHLPAFMHPSAPLLPALLAYGEWKRASGKDFLLAFIMGFEIETRISIAMGGTHFDEGWHPTATMGHFGAAAGVAKLAGLKKEEASSALGLAATQASGIRRVFGSMAKSFHPGKAAADGLLSVLLAQKGYTCPGNTLEGKKDLASLLSRDFNAARGLEGLGQSYTIMKVTFKPFASCLYTHPVIDGIIYLRNRYQLKPDAVENIHCAVSKFCFDGAGQLNPRTALEAKFSTPYCAAIALIEGKAGEDLFVDSLTQNWAIQGFMKKVQLEKSPLGEKEAQITVRLQDGTTLRHKVDHPLGDPQNPVSDRELREKAMTFLKPIFKEKGATAILETIGSMEEIRNMGELTSLLTKKKTARTPSSAKIRGKMKTPPNRGQR